MSRCKRPSKKKRVAKIWKKYRKGALKISRTRILENRLLHEIACIKDKSIIGYTNIFYPRMKTLLKYNHYYETFRRHVLTLISFYEFDFYKNKKRYGMFDVQNPFFVGEL